MKIFFLFLTSLVALSISWKAMGADNDSTSIYMLALKIGENNPDLCFGFEHLDGLRDMISGKEVVARAKENWETFAQTVAKYTDYEVSILDDKNILIRPKLKPDIHTAPIVMEPVMFLNDPFTWKELNDALKGIQFVDKNRKFETSLIPDSSNDLIFSSNKKIVENLSVLVEKNKNGTLSLANVLFFMARSVKATQWNYSPFDVEPIGMKISYPRKLRFSNLSFSGKTED